MGGRFPHILGCPNKGGFAIEYYKTWLLQNKINTGVFPRLATKASRSRREGGKERERDDVSSMFEHHSKYHGHILILRKTLKRTFLVVSGIVLDVCEALTVGPPAT